MTIKYLVYQNEKEVRISWDIVKKRISEDTPIPEVRRRFEEVLALIEVLCSYLSKTLETKEE